VNDYSVGDVARIAGVTVRLLHHYDDIGLLVPSGRTAAGYRRYGYAELERLQQILAYRVLGLDLDVIAKILGDPSVDPVEHLRRRHSELTAQIDALRAQLAAVEKTMEARKMGIQLTPEEMFEVFGDADPTQYDDAVRERWGETEAFRQSNSRVSSYGKDDWLRIRAEAEEIAARQAGLFSAGVPAGAVEAMDAVEAHRQHITRWFYDCGPEMHRGLGEMYVTDPRFTAHYEGQVPGLAAWVRDAIAANADRQGS
jgi:MerR family transcriptional regulator, thiopeptide resistance regulator